MAKNGGGGGNNSAMMALMLLLVIGIGLGIAYSQGLFKKEEQDATGGDTDILGEETLWEEIDSDDLESDPDSSAVDGPITISKQACDDVLLPNADKCFSTTSDDAGEAGIKWFWDSEDPDGVGQACRDAVGYYIVKVSSTWGPLELKTKITNKNQTTAGIKDSQWYDYFSGKDLTFKLMAYDKDDKPLLPKTREINVSASNATEGCKSAGITPTPMWPNWNKNKNLLMMDIYASKSASYEAIWSGLETDQGVRYATSLGEGSKNVGGGSHDVIIPKDGYMRFDVDNDGHGSHEATYKWIKEEAEDRLDENWEDEIEKNKLELTIGPRRNYSESEIGWED
jgi:hypothetical protein